MIMLWTSEMHFTYFYYVPICKFIAAIGGPSLGHIHLFRHQHLRGVSITINKKKKKDISLGVKIGYEL